MTPHDADLARVTEERDAVTAALTAERERVHKVLDALWRKYAGDDAWGAAMQAAISEAQQLPPPPRREGRGLMPQPREWVTYEVRVRKVGSRTWRRDWGVGSKSRASALRKVKMRREEYTQLRFRAVRIRHTEEVIG